jgi:hypothetical protein
MLFNPSTGLSLTSFTSSSTTKTDLAASITSSTILAANASRKGVAIWNNSISNLFLDFASTVSLTSYSVKIAPQGYFEMPFNYQGIISGIWDVADTNGKALIREFI